MSSSECQWEDLGQSDVSFELHVTSAKVQGRRMELTSYCFCHSELLGACRELTLMNTMYSGSPSTAYTCREAWEEADDIILGHVQVYNVLPDYIVITCTCSSTGLVTARMLEMSEWI